MKEFKMNPGLSTLFFLGMFALVIGLMIRTTEAQVACRETGNHLIKVGKAQSSDQLVDCESAALSKGSKHTLTWQASGKDTLSIEFAAEGNPFLNFACKNQKKCSSGTIDPNARLGVTYKYTVTLNSGGNVYTEDPGVIIQP